MLTIQTTTKMKRTLQLLSAILVLFASTNAFAQIKPNGSNQVAKSSALPQVSYGETSKINYVRTFGFLKAMTTETGIGTQIDNDNVKETTQYLDGLGRPIQTVARRALPGGSDLVQYMLYDEYGRQVYQPMAYGTSSVDEGKFVLNPSSDMSSFLNGHYPGEDIFYGLTEFEKSPLGRPTKQMAPGNSWAGSGRGVSSTWRPNTTADDVRKFTLSGSTPTASSEYPSQTIWVAITADEDGNEVREYTDKLGRVILKGCKRQHPMQMVGPIG